MITISALIATALVTTPASTDSLVPQAESDLGATTLAQGRNVDAISELEAMPAHDPAQLINLGIAYAREGDAEKARVLFRTAAASDNPIELETANGSLTNSRRLARKALRMLENGDFSQRSAERTASRVTLRE